MALPTKPEWSDLKSDAGIAKSPWYKKADAAVGPALDKLEKAKAQWKKAKNSDNAKSYLAALSDLHNAFRKFLNKKDLTAAGALKTRIEGWMTEVEDKHEKLVAKMPELEGKNAKQLEKIFDEFIL